MICIFCSGSTLLIFIGILKDKYMALWKNDSKYNPNKMLDISPNPLPRLVETKKTYQYLIW